MGYRKANEFAFDEERKENFIKRLKALVGARSVRAAAKDWGLSFSTLNNYLSRGTEPSFIAMQAIAAKEQVTLDWLAFGHEPDSNLDRAIAVDEVHRGYADPAKCAWNMIFDSLEPDDQKKILEYCFKEGARSMVGLVASVKDVDMCLMNLPLEDKERLLRLNEQLKKGSSEANQQTAEAGLTSHDKKAG